MRPRRLQQKINAYFRTRDEAHGRYGPSDLAAFIGVDRETFYSYLENDELKGIVKLALTRIAGQLETSDYWDASRAIFLLKQRQIAGYSDKADKSAAPVEVRVRFGEQTDEAMFE